VRSSFSARSGSIVFGRLVRRLALGLVATGLVLAFAAGSGIQTSLATSAGRQLPQRVSSVSIASWVRGSRVSTRWFPRGARRYRAFVEAIFEGPGVAEERSRGSGLVPHRTGVSTPRARPCAAWAADVSKHEQRPRRLRGKQQPGAGCDGRTIAAGRRCRARCRGCRHCG